MAIGRGLHLARTGGDGMAEWALGAEALERRASLLPRDAEAPHRLGLINVLRGECAADRDAALSYYRRAIADWTRAIELNPSLEAQIGGRLRRVRELVK